MRVNKKEFLVKWSHMFPLIRDEAMFPTRDRFALIQPEIRVNGTAYRMDIRYRMLQPHELAAAMGFPEGYIFSGSKTDSVRMIGNAVAVNMAKSLISSLLEAPKQMTLEVMN